MEPHICGQFLSAKAILNAVGYDVLLQKPTFCFLVYRSGEEESCFDCVTTDNLLAFARGAESYNARLTKDNPVPLPAT